MLHHFRRFGLHPEKVRCERGEQSFQDIQFFSGAGAHHDAIRLFKSLKAPSQPQVFRHTGKMTRGMRLFKSPAGARGQLRGNEHQGAGREMFQATFQTGQDEGGIRLVLLIDRSVVGQPQNIRVFTCRFGIVAETQSAGLETSGQKIL